MNKNLTKAPTDSVILGTLMKSNNWVCNACCEPNSMTLNKCTKCGCPQGANGEVTQQFQNPDLYHSKKASKSLQSTLALIITFPIFLLTALYQGKPIFFALCIGSLISILIIDKHFFRVFSQSSWAQKSLFCFVGLNFIIFGSRLVYESNLSDSNVIFIAALTLILNCMFFIYLKYSKKGVEFLNDYKTKYQS
jgi:hypothetical protein